MSEPELLPQAAPTGRGPDTPEHAELRARVRSWVAERLRPQADAWEAAGGFPHEVFAEAGQVAIFGWKVGPEVGGAGPDFLADAVVTEELAGCGSAGVGAALGAHKDLGPYYIWRFGTDEQRQRWLPDAVAGRSIGALAVTEPGAGSDVAGIRTRATPTAGGDWVLSGTKTFITNGSWADTVVVAAVTDPDRGGHHGLSLFVVEAGDPGFTAQRIRTLGWRTSHTGELSFADVRLPGDRLLGGTEQRGRGFVAIMQNFQWERIVMALSAVRSSERLLADAAARLGDPAPLAAPAAEVAAAASLTAHAVRLHLAGEDAVREVSMAKTLACAMSVHTCEAVLATLGHRALAEPRWERALRDARLGPIGGGTTEIMHEVIGRSYGL